MHVYCCVYDLHMSTYVCVCVCVCVCVFMCSDVHDVCMYWVCVCAYLINYVIFVSKCSLYVFTIILPWLSDPRNFITVLLVTREPEQTTLLF